MIPIAPFAVGLFVVVGLFRIWVAFTYPARTRYPRLSWDYEENHDAQ